MRPDATAKEIADREGVDLRLYRVIYNAIEDVEAAMKGMLDPVFEEKVLGHAEVRQTFKASGVGTIAGSYVQDGTFERKDVYKRQAIRVFLPVCSTGIICGSGCTGRFGLYDRAYAEYRSRTDILRWIFGFLPVWYFAGK